MLLSGKDGRKRWRALKQAVIQFGWQTVMSFLGSAASKPMRRRYGTVLVKNGSYALGRAEHLMQRELEQDPNDIEAAILLATIASTKGNRIEAARHWKAILTRRLSNVDRRVIKLARRIHLTLGDVDLVEELARSGTGIQGLYESWCEAHDTVDRTTQEMLAAVPRDWPNRPLISILMLHRGSDCASVREAVRSIRSQAYPCWELELVLQTKIQHEVHTQLRADGMANMNVWPADGESDFQRAVAEALDHARGEYCVIHDGCGVLPPHALLAIAWEIVHNASGDWIYSDFDHIDERGRRYAPCFLGGPDQEPTHVLQRTRGLCAFRKNVMQEDPESLAAIQRGDTAALALSLAGRVASDRIKHIPSVLRHLSASDRLDLGGRPMDQAAALISRYHARSGIRVEVSELHSHDAIRVRFPVPDPAPLVSIIIPTRDALSLLRACIDSIRGRTRYPAIEIIVVDNDSRETATLRYLQSLKQRSGFRVMRVAEPFNWSRLNNLAAGEARGEILCLLNNDVEVINESWLSEMVSHAVRPDVGVVGAMLWDADGRLQHGGVEFVPQTGAVGHVLSGLRRHELPPRARVVQTSEAVTGACLTVRKEVYDAVGGMDEVALPVGYSDVDFCLKVADRLGLRAVWTPFAELLHLESATRGKLATAADRVRHNNARRILQNRWYEKLIDSRCYRAALKAGIQLQDSYPGAVARLNRYRCPPGARLAFVHVPKTAGVSTRRFLRDVLPSPSVLSLSAKTMLACYEGDRDQLARAQHRLRDAIVLFGHFGVGFGEVLDWPCTYGTIVRDPVARVISHYRHLFASMYSPFAESALAKRPLALLLRKGAIPGNLMLRRILGDPPEATAWRVIDAQCPHGAGFVGFGLPDALWRQCYEEVLDAPDVVPDADVSKVERAMRILEHRFAFVGRAEALEDHLRALATALGAGCTASLEHANAADGEVCLDLPPEDIEAAKQYNMLDRMLYDRIVALPGGYLLDKGRLSGAHLASVAGRCN